VVRLGLPPPAGRQRVNVLAALNALTPAVITVVHETSIHSHRVCQRLGQRAALKLSVPSTPVLDNARYQRCQFVQELAAAWHLELLCLPSYAPPLHWSERFWQCIKTQCLAAQYDPTLSEFREAILRCINTATEAHKVELSSWLSLQFQSFQEVKIMIS